MRLKLETVEEHLQMQKLTLEQQLAQQETLEKERKRAIQLQQEELREKLRSRSRENEQKRIRAIRSFEMQLEKVGGM